jgi:hypothetical protein
MNRDEGFEVPVPFSALTSQPIELLLVIHETDYG